MLRRAASSAYSWWWASHIRTNQSKWLDNNLQEMDDRVKSMLKIIEADADTFSKKAEIYFKKRPELIKFVEETYRAYRALAERYDHISGELHKANHTIVNAFPDQVQFDMQDEDDDHLPKAIRSINFSRLNRLAIDVSEDSLISNIKENFDKSHPPPMIARGKAPEEIDRIQKEILVLQTEKEFIRSSYENAIARYQEIEELIAAMQDELFLLQDEFSDSVVIDDEEARTLMATAALRSCEDTLVNLEEKQKRSAQLTRMGSRRILMAKEKLKSFKGDPGVNKIIFEESDDINFDAATEEEVSEPKQEPVQISHDMSVVELAERINELVNKVITLELTTSSQNAQIESLRMETDELHRHVESLEEEKLTLMEGSSSLSNRLKETEKEFHEIPNIKKLSYAAKDDESTSVDDACLHVTANFQKSQSSMHEKANFAFTSQEEETALLNMEPPKSQEKETKGNDGMDGSVADETSKIQGKVADTSLIIGELGTQLVEKDDFMGLLQSLFNGSNDKEKILLTEYTSILRNYKQIKKRLSEVEKKNQDYDFKTTTRLLELKKANDMKDEKLRLMQQLLSTLQTNPGENELEVSNEEESSGQRDSKMFGSTNAEYSGEKDATLETIDTLQTTSTMAEKFRRDIDALLDENLDFWLRFSTSFQQIQKFQTEFDDLHAAFKRMTDRSIEEGSDSFSADSVSSIDKQLRELKTGLQVWLEQNDLLNGELQNRFSSLCNIQEDISGALVENLESDKVQFSPYEAAKFQGEVSNMQQENSKVADELQAGLVHVRGLRAEVENTLLEIHEKIELSSSAGSQHYNRPFKYFPSRPRIPLRNFLFGVKPKKKPSIFGCVNPAYQKQYSDLSSGFPS